MIQNLWPSRTDVMASEESPYTILKGQIQYVSQIDFNLQASLDQISVIDPRIPLFLLPFNTQKFPSSLMPFTACRLIIRAINKAYSFEVVRVMYDANRNYPATVYDSVNEKTFTTFGVADFSSCLKSIFSSPECMMKIKFLLSDATR